MSIQLSDNQKKFIVDYLMCFSKGIVESEEFWEDIPQEEVEENFDEWRDAIEDYIEVAKEHILATIGT